MKKNKMMRIASVLLVAVLLSTCAISGTFAKYVTEATDTDTASVAKWDIDFAGNNANSKDFAFNLFDTIVDTEDGQTDADVATGKIAPGTKGSFQIVLTNDSEVNATYAINLTEPDGLPDALTFDVSEATGSLGMTATKTITVSWIWEFRDTVENTYAGKSWNVTATVTVTQAN